MNNNKITTYEIKSNKFNSKFSKFSIKEGEMYFLLGRNGIGKTTLLKKLSGFEVDYSKYKIKNVVTIKRNDVINAYRHVNLDPKTLKIIINNSMKREVTIDTTMVSQESNDFIDLISIGKQITEAIEKEHKNKIKKIKTNLDIYKTKAIEELKQEQDKTMSLFNIKISFWEAKKEGYQSSRYISGNMQLSESEMKEKIKNDYKLLIKYIEAYDFTKKDYLNYKDSGIGELLVKDDESDFPRLKSIYLGYKKELSQLDILTKAINDARQEYYSITLKNTYRYSTSINNIIYSILPRIHQPEEINHYMYSAKKSSGEITMERLNAVFDKYKNYHSDSILTFDETFNNLDSRNTKIMIKKLEELPVSKIITTHSSLPIKFGKIENIIAMWEDNNKKMCIANFSDMKKYEKHDEIIKEFIFEQTIQALFEFKDKNILFVEGYTDKLYLGKYLDSSINIIPIGGAHYAKLALNLLYSSNIGKIKFLFDNDPQGKTASKLVCEDKGDDITKNIFGDVEGDIEMLISGLKKRKARKRIFDGEFEKEIKLICKNIEKQYKR